jgi:hypothetical protein
MARTTSPIDITTTIALATEHHRVKDARRQAHWSRLLAGQMRQADADALIALMAATILRLTATAAL